MKFSRSTSISTSGLGLLGLVIASLSLSLLITGVHARPTSASRAHAQLRPAVHVLDVDVDVDVQGRRAGKHHHIAVVSHGHGHGEKPVPKYHHNPPHGHDVKAYPNSKYVATHGDPGHGHRIENTHMHDHPPHPHPHNPLNPNSRLQHHGNVDEARHNHDHRKQPVPIPHHSNPSASGFMLSGASINYRITATKNHIHRFLSLRIEYVKVQFGRVMGRVRRVVGVVVERARRTSGGAWGSVRGSTRTSGGGRGIRRPRYPGWVRMISSRPGKKGGVVKAQGSLGEESKPKQRNTLGTETVLGIRRQLPIGGGV
ncbi:hypothetical protein DFH27DRAFT_569140 [Peziza echinospora]|nr:hypothetical protein DFH27DRAFT_569140 [Peziza echinospora]